MAIALARIDQGVGSAFGIGIKARFSVTTPAAGTHYTSGGEVLNFSSLVPGTSQPPKSIKLAGGNTAGYTFDFTIGSDLTNSLLRIYSTADTELNSGADYPTSLLSATFIIEAEFTKY